LLVLFKAGIITASVIEAGIITADVVAGDSDY